MGQGQAMIGNFAVKLFPLLDHSLTAFESRPARQR
jgi:hypothetical protein